MTPAERIDRPGASADAWSHFDLVLGLGDDLLPVVADANATISGSSNLKTLGKTPSVFNVQGLVVGIAGWTQKRSTPQERAAWARDGRLGMCLQTRLARAIDVDVGDVAAAEAIADVLSHHLGAAPKRTRANSAKFLLLVECAEPLTKRVIRAAAGAVELLADGQQCVIDSTHPSGARYEWLGGLPDAIPSCTVAQLNALWADLEAKFAVAPSATSAASNRAATLSEAVGNDPVAQFLLNTGRVKRTERDGRLHIACPFESEHTTDTGDSSSTYFPAHTGGYEKGTYRCLHAHCEHRTHQEFVDAIGYVDADLLAEFSAIADAAPAEPDAPQPITDKAEVLIEAAKPQRFRVMTAAEFAVGKPLTWFIKGVLPRAELGMVYGESTAGKTFAILDMVAHVALGRPWRGLITRPARVVYVAAEGAAGMRNRIRALCQHLGLQPEQLPIKFIADAPNLMDKADAIAIAKAIVAAGGADLVVLDTFAQVMAGGNENSGEDVGKVLAHCRGIGTATRGATVLPVHHSGKDVSKGARGWSGIRAAMDVELEVVRVDDRRSITVTKIKDGPGEGKEFAFRLDTIVLGLDEDDEEITSCVVSPVEGAVRKVAQAKLGQFERAVLDAVEELSGLVNELADLEDTLQLAVSKVPFEGTGEDRRRDNCKRAVANLCDKKGLLVRDGVGLRVKSQISAG